MTRLWVRSAQVVEAIEKLEHWVLLSRKRLPSKRLCTKAARRREECLYCSAEDTRDHAADALMGAGAVLAELLAEYVRLGLDEGGLRGQKQRARLQRFVEEIAKL
jgi:hypothetical protein